MTKKISKHCKHKKQLEYDGEGLHFVELAELALDHPILFLIISQMIKYNISKRLIIKLIDMVV